MSFLFLPEVKIGGKMVFLEFLQDNYLEIIISVSVALVAIALLIVFAILQGKDKHKEPQMYLGMGLVFAIVLGLIYIFISRNVKLYITIPAIVMVIGVYGLIIFVLSTKHQEEEPSNNVQRIATLGILAGLSTLLMFFDFPIFPQAPYLKAEISVLIVFLVLLWYDLPAAIIVSLVTNFVHGMFNPGIIKFLDEGMNFIATMSFLLPSIIYLYLMNNEKRPNRVLVIILTIIGVLLTTVVMVLYNYFINLRYVYTEIDMSFNDVVFTFGIFNILKWSLSSLVINLTWPKLYYLKQDFN